ncbi:hypothetical protein FB567DRAFT_158551 [Paraphoma chrysanthemicola]|uniref:C3H1-type domain-containing protein n=1 Tax=Paraphoma chrysanthemicola TaxID=798071 RepID=A0A8K0RHG0_9PLEO|nr:hypothetical protein FB567DRAFT_158551 [Paraphoma chrysanthemicola]
MADTMAPLSLLTEQLLLEDRSTSSARDQSLDGDVEDMSAANVSRQAQDDSYVLLLLDLHSHPFLPELLQSPETLTSRLGIAVRKAISQIQPEPEANFRIEVRAYGYAKKLDHGTANKLQLIVCDASLKVRFNFVGVQSSLNHPVSMEQMIQDSCRTALWESSCVQVLLAAGNYPTYHSFLRLSFPKMTIVQGETTGPGVQILLPQYKLIELRNVLIAPSMRDRLAEDYIALKAFHTIAALVSASRLDDSLCFDHRCGLSHTAAIRKAPKHAITTESHTYGLRAPGNLPPYSQVSSDRVPVNEFGFRLDYHIKRPPAAVCRAYKDMDRKPCNWHHLTDECRQGSTCAFDHSELDPDVLLYMRYVAQKQPCKYGSACRRAQCIYGHVCQNHQCLNEEVVDCPFKKFHGVDPTVIWWVKDGLMSNPEDEASMNTPSVEEKDDVTDSFWF